MKGGYAFYAHGGYAQAIYADFVQGDVNGVELLQFGVYRGIELDDWYRILNMASASLAWAPAITRPAVSWPIA